MPTSPTVATAREGDIVKTANERTVAPVVDYSEARERAIKWLGDRYLLAKPINAAVRRRPASVKVDSRTPW